MTEPQIEIMINGQNFLSGPFPVSLVCHQTKEGQLVVADLKSRHPDKLKVIKYDPCILVNRNMYLLELYDSRLNQSYQMDYHKAICLAEEHGLYTASFTELLAFADIFHDKQRQRDIVAAGSIISSVGKEDLTTWLPMLSTDLDGQRELTFQIGQNLGWWEKVRPNTALLLVA